MAEGHRWLLVGLLVALTLIVLALGGIIVHWIIEARKPYGDPPDE